MPKQTRQCIILGTLCYTVTKLVNHNKTDTSFFTNLQTTTGSDLCNPSIKTLFRLLNAGKLQLKIINEQYIHLNIKVKFIASLSYQSIFSGFLHHLSQKLLFHF